MVNEIKKQCAIFWDGNPCGGNWHSQSEYIQFIQRTEPYIYNIINKYSWTNKYVLEVGCGQGPTLNYLPGLGARVHGVDMSIDSLKKAKYGALEMGISDKVELSVGDAEKLQFADDTFDAVICNGVLHHTNDTQAGIMEIYRVLKPGGFAIVMLYRSGNPKWWMTKTFRLVSKAFDRITGKEQIIADWLRHQQKNNERKGTALIELFGVPILKAFSNKQCRKMFADFSSVEISNHQPGFERNCDIIRCLEPLRPLFRKFDQLVYNCWGFYQVIEAKKQH